MLAALAEYAWVTDVEATTINNLWKGWNIVPTIIGGLGFVATLIAGTRGLRFVTLGAGAVVIIALRNLLTFDYPTIFYGSYEIVRWVILLIMVGIFVIPIMVSLIARGTE